MQSLDMRKALLGLPVIDREPTSVPCAVRPATGHGVV